MKSGNISDCANTALFVYFSKYFSLLLLLFVGSNTLAQVPVVNSFIPTSGPAGTSVTITGSNFNNVPSGNIVFFGAVKAVVTSASATSLTATVPAGVTYQPISVTVNGLSGYSSAPFIVTFPGSQPLTPSSFYPKVDSSTDLHPNGIAIADFDGDGKPDVATPNNYSTIGSPASVSILRNTATGSGISFEARKDLVTGVLTYAIAAGDLNGDGKPDLISSSIVDKTISVFKNTSTSGNISFAPKSDYTTETNPYSIAIGDIDNDGKPDVAVTNHLSNSVSIFKNNSTGGNISFAPKTDLTTALAPGTVSLGDLDGDGKIDMVVTNELSSSLSIFRNTSTTGNIAFAARQDFATGTSPYGASLGDFNNDGKTDIVVSNNGANTISTFKNNSTSGSIILDAKADRTVVAPYLVSVADVNGDGKPDIVVAGNNLQILQNTSTVSAISFGGTVTSALSPNAFAIGICDFDGDNKGDLAGAIFTSNIVSFLKNRSNEPFISYISPVTAAVGATVVITGERFTGATAVKFGGVPASSFTIVNSTTIHAVVSTGVSGKVEVTNAYGTAFLDGFIFAGPPIISSFTPAASGQGQTVTISGFNFSNVTAVNFGGVAAASFTVISPTTIQAVPATGASGNITVTTSYGSGTLGGFTFLPFPFVTAFNPAAAAAGSSVVITGSNFTGATAVNFGGVAAASYVVNSPTSITAVVGSGASGSVSVTTGIGTGVKAGFTFIPAPVITSATALTGRTGTPITISGSNFTGVTSVSFGGFPANSFTIVSPTVINAVVGVGASGNIAVTGPGGTATLAGFVFIPPPSIASVTPAFATAGSSIVISGTGFSPIISGNTVTIGSVTATVTAASASSLTVIVPAVTTNKPVEVLVGNLIATSPAALSTIFTVPDTSFNNSNSFSAPLRAAGKFNSSGFSSDGSITTDIDGDNKQDIISTNILTKMISILRNTSAGSAVSFASQVDLPSFWLPGGITAGDLDGDGKPDLVCGNESFSNTLSIFRNTSTPGTISFAARIDYSTGTAAVMNVSLGDLDNDGRKDIIMRNSVTNNTSLSVYRNSSTPGNITFDNPVTFTIGSAGSTLFDIVTEDMDGDGKLDIVSDKPDLTCLLNQSIPGTLSFSSPVTIYPTGVNAIISMSVNDINSDGKKDIVTLSGSTIAVYKNQSTSGNLSFAATNIYSFPGSTRGLATGDLNGDGKPEIVALQGGASNIYQYSVFNNMCNGNTIAFGNKVSRIYSSLLAFGYTNITDVDGDNKMDIILTHTSSDSVYILRNQMAVSVLQLCSNSSAALTSNISGTVYQWQQNSGSGFVNINDNATFSGTATATLQITSPPAGWNGYKYRCWVNNSIAATEVTVNITASPVAQAGADAVICAGGPGTPLSGSGGTTYVWTPASGLSNPNIANPLATPVVTTAYILTVANGSTCTAKDTVLITVNQPLPSAVTINTSGNTICAGDNITFTATPVNGGTSPAYQWKVNGINRGTNSNQYSTASLNDKDTVTVLLTSNSGCTSNTAATSNSIVMNVTQLATPVITGNNRVYTVTNIDAAAAYSWQVSVNGNWTNVVPVATGSVFTAQSAGEYRVMAIKGPCTAYSASLITNRITVANNPFGIFVYPNPALKEVIVDSIKLSQNWEVLKVMNTEGRIVLPVKNVQNQSRVVLNIEQLGKGTYFIHLRRKDGEATTIKFVKN